MPSKDVLGYPPGKHFWRTGLETAWKAAFGALDILDFETFLKESADRTYADALKQIEVMGGKSESRHISEAKEEVEKGGIEQYRAVAENLRQGGDEYHASAIDTLIAELIVERNKPKKAARAKPAPKPKLLETFAQPAPTPEKDYIAKLCKQSPMGHNNILEIVDAVEVKDVGRAIQIIKDCKTLDEFDKFELEELLKHKEAGITPMKMPALKKIAPKPKMKIIPVREVIGEREKEKEEEVMPFKAVEYEFHTLNLQNARLFWRDYKQYLPEILRMGLQAWLETHRVAFNFPLTTKNIEALSKALEYAIVPSKASIRDMTANEFMQRYAYLVITQGLEPASKNFDWQVKYDYYKGTLKEKLPDIGTFKRDVLEEMRRIKVEF